MPRPELECCTPFWAPTPSGYAWIHSKKCILISMRNQKVRIRTQHPAGTAIDQKEPSAFRPLLTWFLHEPGCNCDEGCGYVNHHLDDDDDRTMEKVSPRGRA